MMSGIRTGSKSIYQSPFPRQSAPGQRLVTAMEQVWEPLGSHTCHAHVLCFPDTFVILEERLVKIHTYLRYPQVWDNSENGKHPIYPTIFLLKWGFGEGRIWSPSLTPVWIRRVWGSTWFNMVQRICDFVVNYIWGKNNHNITDTEKTAQEERPQLWKSLPCYGYWQLRILATAKQTL